ncbi:hypothetical protein ACIQM4_10600 [Streptomyces sp. NPDC091272]|uniref:hypothetical protein n=1 Tax=Streptomyces sp. NPDC091272 TaxID=3365981 RepID=UPI0038050E78
MNGRHQHRPTRSSAADPTRLDRGSRLALAALALAGPAGPAWVLREQADPLLGAGSHPPAVAEPDDGLPRTAANG